SRCRWRSRYFPMMFIVRRRPGHDAPIPTWRTSTKSTEGATSQRGKSPSYSRRSFARHFDHFVNRNFHMKTNGALIIAVLIAATGFVLAQQPSVKRIDLQRHDLSIPGREALQVIVEIAPGQTAPMHTHPGEEIIYILEGTLEYEIGGKL